MNNVVSLFENEQKIEERPVVVLADDDPSIRLMVRHVLESENYEIIEAEDGLDAIKAVEKEHPALVLLDAVMPGLDGFTTCQQLKERGHVDVPVIMLTGLDDDASVERAYEVGAIDYVTKPIKWAVLKHRVRSVVRSVMAERKVHRLEYRDTLTQLPNRLLFVDRLEQAIVRAGRHRESIALLVIDIDDFKLVNDSFGHEAGDKLIKAVADLLSKAMRRADTVARIGGDEFAIIIENVNGVDDAISIADNVTTILEHNVRMDNQEAFTSASVGIAMFPDDAADASTLLKNADTAMFRAKEQGRRCFQFYKAEMSVNAMERLELENSIHQAIENSEMVIHYQPTIDIHNNEISGVEALLRWQHPEKGIICPEDFLQVAIDSGQIVAIGEWMIKTICHQLRVWKEAGLEDQNIAINLTAKQLQNQSLIPTFKMAMEEHQIEGSELTIEVTEKSLVSSHGEIEVILNQLHDMGMTICIDDFGIGFASLTNLKELPIDVVKIDDAFIAGVPDNEHDVAVVNAIAGLTRGLKIKLLAEGIENERQLEMLKGLGCQFAQGFYWSKALPVDQYDQFYLNRIYNLA